MKKGAMAGHLNRASGASLGQSSGNHSRGAQQNVRSSAGFERGSGLNFTAERLIDASMEQSLVEWLQGTFENLKINEFNALYDGEV
jgi:hypothetical protein